MFGESVVATVSGLQARWCTAAILTALPSLTLAAAIWWLYFDRWRAMPAGGMRSGYVWAQGHLLVFAGIAATAVGLEFTIEAAADGRDLELADRLPLGAGIASFLVAMALIRSATRRWDWVVGLRLATGAVVLGLSLVDGIARLVLAAIAAIVVAEVAYELRRSPAEPARARPRLPHELRRPRGSG